MVIFKVKKLSGTHDQTRNSRRIFYVSVAKGRLTEGYREIGLDIFEPANFFLDSDGIRIVGVQGNGRVGQNAKVRPMNQPKFQRKPTD
jgi:hypothetical protein